jgi:PAS domain S-box-containing protein
MTRNTPARNGSERGLAEYRRVEHDLQHTQQRLRLALEAGSMGTWDYDVRRDRLEWSRELASVVGAQMKPLIGRLGDSLSCVHPEDRVKLERAIRTAVDHGKGLTVETRVVVGSTRRERWLLVKGRPFHDEAGRLLGIGGVAMDITKRKEGEAVRHRLAQSERLRALGEMASGIAHDLNQSLALITGYSDMARQELSAEVPDIALLREMVDITARAAVEGGHVGEMLQDAARLTAPRWRDAAQAEGRPIELAVDGPPGCTIDGSPVALREAITNLIFNAVDALPKGGTIKLGCRHHADQVIVKVSDTGTGMPPDVRARIFDPFFTTKGERGTGLGLPQVLTVVERHGGTVDLDSQPDRGTTFTLKFPKAADGRGRGHAMAEHKVSAPLRRIRILVVEDEEQLARMAGLVLTQRGHQVVVAGGVDEALEHLGEKFDLVISDLGLGPGKNGWDLAEAVRKRWPGTRIVLVTGWGAAIDPAEAHERGVDEVIAKPYRIADLRQVADHVAGAPQSG